MRDTGRRVGREDIFGEFIYIHAWDSAVSAVPDDAVVFFLFLPIMLFSGFLVPELAAPSFHKVSLHS